MEVERLFSLRAVAELRPFARLCLLHSPCINRTSERGDTSTNSKTLQHLWNPPREGGSEEASQGSNDAAALNSTFLLISSTFWKLLLHMIKSGQCNSHAFWSAKETWGYSTDMSDLKPLIKSLEPRVEHSCATNQQNGPKLWT